MSQVHTAETLWKKIQLMVIVKKSCFFNIEKKLCCFTSTSWVSEKFDRFLRSLILDMS